MLRKDTLFMLESNWEPHIPTQKNIEKQIDQAHGRVGGSVRLATKHIHVTSRSLQKNI